MAEMTTFKLVIMQHLKQGAYAARVRLTASQTVAIRGYLESEACKRSELRLSEENREKLKVFRMKLMFVVWAHLSEQQLGDLHTEWHDIWRGVNYDII